MNAFTNAVTDGMRRAGAYASHELNIHIGALDFGLDVVDFNVEAGLCDDYTVDVTVTSPQRHIDGSLCVGRRATLSIRDPGAQAGFPRAASLDPSTATFSGIVTQWQRVRDSRDEAAYRLRIEPRFAALLKRVHGSRVFRDLTLPDIITQLVVDHRQFEARDVEFMLEGEPEMFEQVVMYEESVWNFITRHCRRAGIFWYYRQPHGGPDQAETLVFGDSPRACLRALDVPLLPDAGLGSGAPPAVLSLHRARTLVPAAIESWDHDYRCPDDPLSATATVSADSDDRSVFGQQRRSNERHLTPAHAQVRADVRRERLVARQTTFLGTSNVTGIAPGVVLTIANEAVSGAEYGLLITSMTMQGSRSEPAHGSFEAMPAHCTYRPDYDYETHWRLLRGAVTGVVTTADNAPYAWMDEHGRYAVLPTFLRGSDSADRQLLSLRLLRPTSSYQGGFHSPLLPHTEVTLAASEGDVDRLYIAGAMHDYSHPDVVHGAQGMFSYAIWRSPLRGAEIVFNDLKDRESARIATVHRQSAVNLGCLLDGRKLPRGEGFEIATQGWGTLRAAKGLFLSSDASGTIDAPHLEMPVAVRELKAALQRVTELADATARANAETADRGTQAALIDALDALRDAGLIASAPGGIAFTTAKSIQQAAGENVIVSAGRQVDVSVVRRLTVAAGELVSICAHRLGIKLFAANGNVAIQAQQGALDLLAARPLRVASTNADVLVSAKTKVVLASGGASITVENGNVVVECPGEFRLRAGSVGFDGPVSRPVPLPELPSSGYRVGERYSHTR